MWVIHFFVSWLVVGEIQAAEILHEKVEMTYYNKEYSQNPVVTLYDYNKTAKAYNFSVTVVKDLPRDFKIGLQVYKRQGNDYHLFAPQLAPTYCDMVKRNDFGFRAVLEEYGNFSNCPVGKGFYYLSNYMPNTRSVPEQFLIAGSYKIAGKMFNKRITFGKFEMYTSIVDSN